MGERYLSIEQVAGKLGTDIESIEEQIWRGRVVPAEKRGRRFLSDRDVYKLRFVFYLQQKRNLSGEQIDMVLETVRPPYNTWQKQLILAGENRGLAGG